MVETPRRVRGTFYELVTQRDLRVSHLGQLFSALFTPARNVHVEADLSD